MRKELSKQYEPKEFEDRIYKSWMDNNYFTAKVDKDKTPYTIVMPPPNITGQLHMGHALDNTLQDILIRTKRMQGYSVLWVPGTDHASIATEARIVEAMSKDGVSKADIGRDGFMERAWEWKAQYGGRIVEQLKKLGTSCDWSRERFTLDDGCSEAVREVFVKLYEKELIYRGERIINWCPTCKTSISEAEVTYNDKDGSFWHIRYQIAGTDEYMQLATTRPETLLGDTAIAVNPNDERYGKYVGAKVILPLCNREIPVIADDYVDMEFGTGVVKITPAHDPNDFEVGLRHRLEIINVMTDDAHINENGGKYQGMERYEARKQIVKDLEASGNLVKIEAHQNRVGSCYRCDTVIEPRISKQWFVKMEPLAKPALKAVREGETKFVPERFDKIYYNWMENIKDWCISRQLWWGHRIPAYHCEVCDKFEVSRTAVEKCSCGGKMHQDPDTLDTWFSSALWPFSTLGWPNKTEDLEYFYPTNTLVTGYDIIFFWVARMVFSSIENMGEVPFDTVFIHGLVLDEQGRKMSKSLGNGVDPLDIIEQYGADALRLMLVTGTSPGQDMRYVEKKVMASRNFANKLWNATRFIMMNMSEEVTEIKLPETLMIEDKWVLSKLNTLIKEVTDNINKYELGVAVSKLYDFIWDVMCDWYIELTKSRLATGGETSINAQKVLLYVITDAIKLLHPFMPFITEEIFSVLPTNEQTIMTSAYPVYDEKLSFEKEEKEFQMVMDAIKAIRNARSEMNVPPKRKAKVCIATNETEIFKGATAFFERLASASEVVVEQDIEIKPALQVVTNVARIFIPMDELVDKTKELERLTKEKTACEKDIAMLSGKVNNQSFVDKAPQKVVDEIKQKLEKANELLNKINQSIDEL